MLLSAVSQTHPQYFYSGSHSKKFLAGDFAGDDLWSVRIARVQPRKFGESEGEFTLLDQFISSEMNKIHPTCRLIDDFLSGAWE
jgi:hypothetical protein